MKKTTPTSMPLLVSFFAASLLMLSACTKNDEPSGTNNNNPTQNGTATLVLDGVRYTLSCFSDRSGTGGGADNCGKVAIFLYKKDLPSLIIWHFPEDASGTFVLGDGNTQRACSQIYGYCGDYASKQITLTKTGAKSFTYSGIVYDPPTNAEHTISGEGYYNN